MLVVSHTTGGGGVRASDVTHYFPTSSKLLLLFLMQNYGSKRGWSKFSRGKNHMQKWSVGWSGGL